MRASRILADRRHLWAFVTGCLAVTAGVVLHLPMYWMGRETGFHLAGMAMDAGMLWGMALICAGVGIAGYGLLPRKLGAQHVRSIPASSSSPRRTPSGRRTGG